MDDKNTFLSFYYVAEDFMFEFSDLEAYKGHPYINIYTIKGLISKGKRPMHDT